MPKPVFTKDASTFTWSVYPLYPEDNPDQVNVVVDYSEGGQLYAYDKGIAEQFFYLFFNNASQTDYTAFKNWLLNVVVGPKNTFTYTDRAGTGHTVRLLDTRNPLRKVRQGCFAGTVALRKEI